MTTSIDPRPLVAHVIYRLDVGGLENGVVNLINHMPVESYRHAVIALADVTEFRKRIVRDDVQVIALNKSPGHGVKLYPRLIRLFRDMRPLIVHTRNLAALEATVPAWASGVPVRIHGEHGRDVGDFDRPSRKYDWVRRLYRPFVTNYVALSQNLRQYLVRNVGVRENRIVQICNGVDTRRFRPRAVNWSPVRDFPFSDPSFWVVGTVGRMQPVKDQLTLAQAFVRALQIDPTQRRRLRLVMIGDGPMRGEGQSLLSREGVADLCWLPGERSDVPEILQGLNCFVLPSRNEGISNGILEAMACGLPVIATHVGGNPELVEPGRTGELVPASNPEELAKRILAYSRKPESARMAGRVALARAEQLFSLNTMVQRYSDLYDAQLASLAPQYQRVRTV